MSKLLKIIGIMFVCATCFAAGWLWGRDGAGAPNTPTVNSGLKNTPVDKSSITTEFITDTSLLCVAIEYLDNRKVEDATRLLRNRVDGNIFVINDSLGSAGVSEKKLAGLLLTRIAMHRAATRSIYSVSNSPDTNAAARVAAILARFEK